jgi:hypothetical protein
MRSFLAGLRSDIPVVQRARRDCVSRLEWERSLADPEGSSP